MSLKTYVEGLLKSQSEEVKDEDKGDQLNTLLRLTFSSCFIKDRNEKALSKDELNGVGFAFG